MLKEILVGFSLFIFTSNIYADELSIIAKSTKELYAQATDKLIPLPKEMHTKVDSLLKERWQLSQDILPFIEQNTDALELFKQAAFSQTDGYVFMDRVEHFDYETEIPSYANEIKLFKLLILQGRLLQEQGSFKKAEQNYLAAVSFIVHLSREELDTIITRLIEIICFNYVKKTLEQSVELSEAYAQDLNVKLKELMNNQDAMQGALRNECLMIKNSFKKTEANYYETGDPGNLLGQYLVDKSSGVGKIMVAANENEEKEMINEIKRLIYEDAELKFSLQMEAFKTRDFKTYNKFQEAHDKKYMRLRNPLFFAAYVLKNLWVYKGKLHLAYANSVATMYQSLSMPSLAKASQKYWDYNESLIKLIEMTEQN